MRCYLPALSAKHTSNVKQAKLCGRLSAVGKVVMLSGTWLPRHRPAVRFWLFCGLLSLLSAPAMFADVAIFGVKTYAVTAGKPVAVTETFSANGACDHAPNAIYTVVVTNGEPGGAHRVSAASVQLNGVEIISENDFSQQRVTVTRRVAVAASNTISVAVKGGAADGFVTVAVMRHIDRTTAVFPEKTYVVSSADSFHETFSATPAGAGESFSMVVRNGSADGSGRVSGSITLNGVEVVAKQDLERAGRLMDVPLVLRTSNDLTIEIKGPPEASIAVAILRHLVDHDGPVVTFEHLVDGQSVPTGSISLSGVVADDSGVARLVIGGQSVPYGVDGGFRVAVNLGPGTNVVDVQATDCEGNTSLRQLHLFVDASPPVISISSPVDGFVTRDTGIVVAGTATDDVGIAGITVNGVAATINGSSWTATVLLSSTTSSPDGTRELVATATDAAGKFAVARRSITLDRTGPHIELRFPYAAVTKYFAASIDAEGTAVDAGSGIDSVTCNGAPATIGNGAFRCTVALAEGPNTVAIRAVDRVGNVSTTTHAIESIIDKQAPHIVAVPSGRINANGWYGSEMVLQFQCTDDHPDGLRCAGDQFVTADGADQKFTGEAIDGGGNRATVTVSLNVDHTRPLLTIDGPDEIVVKGISVDVTGRASDATSGLLRVRCNEQVADLDGDRFRCHRSVTQGWESIHVVAEDRAGNEELRYVHVLLDRDPPVLALDDVPATTRATSIRISGSAIDSDAVAGVTIGGIAATVTDETFAATVPLAPGANHLVLRAVDRAGNAATLPIDIFCSDRPSVRISAPADFTVTAASSIVVTGTIDRAVTNLQLNGAPATVAGNTFSAVVPLAQGRTVVTALATTSSAQVVAASITVYRDAIPPRVAIDSPVRGSTLRSSVISVSGMVDDIVIGTVNVDQVRVTVNGTPARVLNRAYLAEGIALVPGANTIVVIATDAAGNTSTASEQVTFDSSAASRIVSVSGDAQTIGIGGTLPGPLRVRLVDPAGNGVAGRSVSFAVTSNNGSVAGGGGSGRVVTVTSDAAGEAAVVWTLGTRAGAGNNEVVATAAGFASADFHAVGTPGTPQMVVVDSGDHQFGVSGERLPRPLVAVVVDRGSNRLANVPVTFTTISGDGSFDGPTQITVMTDSDGRAWATPRLGSSSGADNNVVRATVSGVDLPAFFTATGRVPGPPDQTRISGVVVDNANVPLSGVTLRIDGMALTTTTDAQGQFVFSPVPVGYVKLIVDGSTTQRPGTWPTLEFSMFTNSGQDNTVGMPIYLLPIDVQRGVQIDETHGATMTLAELPGFSITLAPGSALFPSGGRAGTISATLVHTDKVPMIPAFGQQPRFIVTIQPAGVHFDPPAALSIPNLEGLLPGEITELYSFDHDLGQFVSVGTGTVSDDATTIRSDPGVGIIKSGWHSAGNPTPSGSAGNMQLTLEAVIPPQTGGTAPEGANRRLASRQLRAAADSPAPVVSASADVTAVGACVSLVAKGLPVGGARPGETMSYTGWEIFDDPSDETDDPGAAVLLDAHDCPNQSACSATLRGTRPGVVNVRVHYRSSNGSTVEKATKVQFVDLRMSLASMRFEDTIGLIKDDVVQGVLAPMDTSWLDFGTPVPVERHPTVGYASASPIRIQAVLRLNTPAPVEVPNVSFEVSGLGISNLHGTVTIAPGTTDVQVLVTSDRPLPKAAKYHDVLLLGWKVLPASACTYSEDVGLGRFELYQTLAKPRSKAYLTSVALATRSAAETPAINETQAIEATWKRFSNGSGPAGVQGWDKRPLKYYPEGSNFGGCAMGPPVEAFLLTPTGNGRCGAFAALLKSTFDMNGIASDVVGVAPRMVDNVIPLGFLVKNWVFSTPHASPVLSPLPPPPPGTDAPPNPYLWLFVTPAARPWEEMQPVPPDHRYGDLIDVSGSPGQNSAWPAEKFFSNHGIVRVGSRLLDPSYGLEYRDERDFEVKALDGYYARPAGNLAPNQMVARKIGSQVGVFFFTVQVP